MARTEDSHLCIQSSDVCAYVCAFVYSRVFTCALACPCVCVKLVYLYIHACIVYFVWKAMFKIRLLNRFILKCYLLEIKYIFGYCCSNLQK